VGQVRPSQLLSTYGPGSLVDLPHLSVVVSGIDSWSSDVLAAPEVVERRLLVAVRRALGSDVQALRLPPHLPETRNPFDDWARTGVLVSTFPSWVRCPACDRIGPARPPLFDLQAKPYRPDLARYVHTNCAKARRAPPAVPVRFLLACRSGHLDEFPWTDFVHRGATCLEPILTLFERSQSSRADDVMLRCSCGVSRSMVDAFGERGQMNLPRCRGRHPHLRSFDEQPCATSVRTLLLGASNSWFSVSLRVLAIPSAPTALAQLVEDTWSTLAEISSPATLDFALKNVPALGSLSGYSVEAVWMEIEGRRSAGGPERDGDEDLLGPEWSRLTDPSGVAPGHPDFSLLEVKAPASFSTLIERVVLAERLKEVVALVGFTRVDPPDEPDSSGRPAEMAPISRALPNWVPCTEMRGEGIFIQLREESVAGWEARVNRSRRLAAFQEAHQRWRSKRRLDPHLGWLGARYLALHTLSHLLMREIALECGYGSASISERLYARHGSEPMAGILLYTSAPDSEGTLGGLVGLGEPDTLDRLLRQALSHGTVCASDPMCSEHLPSPDEVVLHGAACHACLFAPETSCERANRYLDRTLAVDTFCESGLGLASP
jgi:hypothetical protein